MPLCLYLVSFLLLYLGLKQQILNYLSYQDIFHYTKTCPEQYKKLIEEQNRCVSNCDNDNNYKYEYDNKCHVSCPNIIGDIIIGTSSSQKPHNTISPGTG